MTDTLPMSVTFFSATVPPNQGECFDADEDNSLFCELGDLENGASTTIEIIVTVNENAGNRFTNTVTAEALGGPTDNNMENNTVTLVSELVEDEGTVTLEVQNVLIGIPDGAFDEGVEVDVEETESNPSEGDGSEQPSEEGSSEPPAGRRASTVAATSSNVVVSFKINATALDGSGVTQSHKPMSITIDAGENASGSSLMTLDSNTDTWTEVETEVEGGIVTANSRAVTEYALVTSSPAQDQHTFFLPVVQR